ncbi:hypothetical protein K438DRAFT_1081157 [Mycena galopus ATCC 62051]|nr:hypothetical protein K438DRAFT_1081157 [Mycena galopus ATCC 62051]
MHPYANPDLVVSYAEDQLTPAAARSSFNNLPDLVRSNSTATVTESLATSRSTGSALAPDTSASSVAPSQSSPRSRVSMFRGREISSPLPIISAPLPTNNISSPLMAPGLPSGWMERSQSPTFQLISLEQARAQRSRSTATQNLSISSTSSTPFPETPPAVDDHSPPSSITSRARARSISTGAKAKTALQNIVSGVPARPLPERQNSEPTVPPGKALKHKKSGGFMRLFNGGGRAEKEEKYSPPPVPSLSDGYAAFNAQQQNGPPSSKSSIHRIPPPQVSPPCSSRRITGTIPASPRPPHDRPHLRYPSTLRPKRDFVQLRMLMTSRPEPRRQTCLIGTGITRTCPRVRRPTSRSSPRSSCALCRLCSARSSPTTCLRSETRTSHRSRGSTLTRIR